MITRAIIGAAIALSICSAAAAQDAIADSVRTRIIDLAEAGEQLVGKIEIVELEPYDFVEFVVPIDPAKLYYVRGACDDDCYSVALAAHNAQKQDIDVEESDAPMLIIGRGESGQELHIMVGLGNCDADTCYVGFGLYEAAP